MSVDATALVECGEPPMSRGWRRILTAKMLALSALVLAFVIIAVAQGRHLDAIKLQRKQPYPPHLKPGW